MCSVQETWCSRHASIGAQDLAVHPAAIGIRQATTPAMSAGWPRLSSGDMLANVWTCSSVLSPRVRVFVDWVADQMRRAR
jgi:hypothetical protein